MIILSHRGFWKTVEEKNTAIAFDRSFNLGFGTETDIRDAKGQLVISHDMPSGAELSLSEFLDILGHRDLPIAFNIKADGLGIALVEILKQRGYTNWFTFDMSAPELMRQLRQGLPAYTRASEFEQHPVCYESAPGVWLDCFESDWFGIKDLEGYLADGKRVCIVSPELHNRDPMSMWQLLGNSDICSHPNMMLCTDFPDRARALLGGST